MKKLLTTTFAGIPSLFLLKSIILYFLLAPPPWCLTVILPCAFLPPVFFKETRSDFSGEFVVISSNVAIVICLLDGVVGLNFLTAMLIPSFFKLLWLYSQYYALILLHSFKEFNTFAILS